MPQKLNATTVSHKHPRPVKVLQFGEGNFLRAFVDWIIDILNEQADFNGDVQIVQPISNGMVDALNRQDSLYHVVLKGIQRGKVFSETRLITSIASAINPYQDFKAFLNAAENAELQFIVSNTTEAGISFDSKDIDSSALANSFPGKLTQLLYHRFSHFKGDNKKGLTFLPCELIEKNGDNLKAAILKYAEIWNLPPEFSSWIDRSNIFCNTLVDRIVPGFPKDTITEVQSSIGYEDNLVVQAEPFHLWVIEGPASIARQFPTSQTSLEVKFVSDLSPYRTRKVRILNGAHTALVPVAYLAGLRTVKESVDDASIGTYIRNAIFDEIIPTLDLPEAELQQFAADVIERFQNPFIKHELLSIALNSISKFKVRVLPSVLEYKARKGALPKNLLHSLAALIRFYKGEWQGHPIPLNDSENVVAFFKAAWQNFDVKIVAEKVLANEEFWGRNLNHIEGLHQGVVDALNEIEKQNLVPIKN